MHSTMRPTNNCRSYVVLIFIAALLCTAFLMFQMGGHYHCNVTLQTYHPVPMYLRHMQIDDKVNTVSIHATIKEERNALSKQLNVMKQHIGREECQRTKELTNSQGGWCKAASRENSGQHRTDMTLIDALTKLFKNKMVGSFGDGPGAYKRELLKLGDVKGYDAYDGAPFCEETSDGRVTFLDLTVPAFGLPLYDWVLSLEVAEHIPSAYENVFLDNICRHSKEGIVLSWARPNQGGLSHINNRPLEYVVQVMDKYDFSHDQKLSHVLQNASSMSWLRQNVNVFRRQNQTYLPTLESWYT